MGSQEFNTDVHFLSNFYHGFWKFFSKLYFCFGSLLAWNWTFLGSPEVTRRAFPWDALASLLELQCSLALQVPQLCWRQPCHQKGLWPALCCWDVLQKPMGERLSAVVAEEVWLFKLLDNKWYLSPPRQQEKCAGPDATEPWLGIRLWTTLRVKWWPPRLKQAQLMLLGAAGLCCCLIPRVVSLRMKTQRY